MKKYIILFSLCLFFSCKESDNHIKDLELGINRKYDVRLSNSIGSDWYECDSIIKVSDKIIKLQNKEDKSPFIEIIIPDNVTVRIYPKQ